MISFAPLQIIISARKIGDRYTHDIPKNHWPYGHFMCNLWHVVLYINMFVQIIFLTLMAIDRYLAVVRHGRLMKLSSYRNSKPVIGKYDGFTIIRYNYFIKLHAVSLPGLLDQYFHIRFGQGFIMTTKRVVWIGTMRLKQWNSIKLNALRLSTESITERAKKKDRIIHLIA